jgi:hypothetical protein
MLRFKNSVRCPKSVFIVAAANNARQALGIAGDTYVTSLNDSHHMAGSKHYSDEAADLRTRDLSPIDIQRWASAIRSRLGSAYQVVIENDHVHVEHDPN